MDSFENSFMCQLSEWREEDRKFYDFKFEQVVRKHAEENSNREAAKKYSVDETVASIHYFFI